MLLHCRMDEIASINAFDPPIQYIVIQPERSSCGPILPFQSLRLWQGTTEAFRLPREPVCLSAIRESH